jgi:cephalosporin-C deacetylase-like acetyl esterase
LRYKPVNDPLGLRPMVTTARKGYRIEKFEFLSEPGIYVPVWAFVPGKRNAETRAILYVNDSGVMEEGADGMEFGILEKLARKGYLVVSIEVRGIGLTRSGIIKPGAGAQFANLFDIDTAAAYMAWFMDESLLAMRTLDVVRSVDYALSRSDVDKRGLRAIGVGRGATWLLFAAALDQRIQALVCDRGLLSYRALMQADRYRYSADMFIPDVLRQFDLPQVAAATGDRQLSLISPLGAMKQVVKDVSDYDWTRKSYAGARFRIEQRIPQLELADQYLKALEF